MIEEIEPILIGELEDIEKESVENFEHEEIDYAIFHLESGFYATQGHCNCEEQAFSTRKCCHFVFRRQKTKCRESSDMRFDKV